MGKLREDNEKSDLKKQSKELIREAVDGRVICFEFLAPIGEW